MTRRIALPLLAAVSVVAAGLAGYGLWHAHQARAVTRAARAALLSGEYARAEHLAQQGLARRPQSQELLLIAAEAALKRADYQAAASRFEKLPDARPQAIGAHLQAARAAFADGRFADAERHLRAVLAMDAAHTEANRELARLLNIEGRRREAAVFHLQLVRAGRFSAEELLLLADPEEPYVDLQSLQRALSAVPDDPFPLIGQARFELYSKRPAEALDLLRKVIARAPEQLEAQGLLGRALLDLKRYDEWLAWHRTLPDAADRDPEIWFLRGRWAQDRDHMREAARCYWEALRRDPNHRLACFYLGHVLTVLGREDDAVPFLRRAEALSELHNVLHPIYSEGPLIPSMLRAAELMEQLGRLWEAWAWYVAVTSYDRRHTVAQSKRDRLLERLRRENPPRTLAVANPALRLDLSGYPRPRYSGSSAGPPRPDAPLLSSVRFEDVSDVAGIDFQYFNSGDPVRKGKRIFETTGGGVGALDFDVDGWPDLYFTQGCRWPPQSGQTEHLDRFFRNRGDGRFIDVTQAAGLGDERYSQGIAVGDYDNDGFPDLYVANIGANRLYRNYGDGTFFDAAPGAGLTGTHWTTSCLMADLNGDAFPDLFDVNYLRGDDVFERLCGAHFPRACAPSVFDGAPEQLHLSLGDGRCADATDLAGVGDLLGKGLGILAADFDASGRLSLFVANDREANFFLVNRSDNPGQPLKLEDRALLNGLAFDRHGRGQACMGVAVDDADGDGLLDLFVTNYFDDYNTLYLQQPGGLFVDASREAGLAEPSMGLLGFGTQFLDADLDGFPDLVVTNGHVDDFTHEGRPYQMRPQFFRNVGGARFVELSSESVGPWFGGAYLGRGLARLDWNRDGREDFAVTHLDAPAALVTNRTEETGRFIAFRLVGVESARDAIGATVRAQCGGFVRERQLTAGDGYQASNQRLLVLGLGDNAAVDELTIDWPSGRKQTLTRLAADREYVLIEGSDVPLALAALSER